MLRLNRDPGRYTQAGRGSTGALRIGIAILVAAVAAGCGSQSSQSNAASNTSHGTLTIAAFEPFSGPNAAFGPYEMAGCLPAVRLINAAGGVLGHNFTCRAVDNRGDPADAVPAARQMIASTSNLVGVLGPSSTEAPATIPILNNAKIVMFTDAGEAAFDRSTFAFLWRNTPGDDTAGYAMALYGSLQGYTRSAAIFGNDPTAQASVPALVKAVPHLGDKLVINEQLQGGQSSYRSEILRVLSAKPQVIYTEADPQTSATFFAELKQLHGLIPIIGTNATAIPSWFKAVAPVVGKSTLVQAYRGGMFQYAGTAGPAYKAWSHSLPLAKVPQYSQYMTDPIAESRYDAVNTMALAMLAAKSTSPAVYNSDILSVTRARPGAVVVHTFAQGKQMLAQGKQIQYVGAAGPEIFNQWRNTTGAYEVLRWTPTGQTYTAATLSAAQLARAAGG